MFEYDPAKSLSNQIKHGIDFEDAQRLWSDPWMVEVPARVEDEHRMIAIGRIAGKHWTAVFVYRSARVRLISMRRSRPKEVDCYESP